MQTLHPPEKLSMSHTHTFPSQITCGYILKEKKIEHETIFKGVHKKFNLDRKMFLDENDKDPEQD